MTNEESPNVIEKVKQEKNKIKKRTHINATKK